MKKLKSVILHREVEAAQLSSDHELAISYLSVAIESLAAPDSRPAGLLMLRTIAEAYGGLDTVAAEAGVSLQTLNRALSPRGNPSLNILLALVGRMGMRLSIQPLPD